MFRQRNYQATAITSRSDILSIFSAFWDGHNIRQFIDILRKFGIIDIPNSAFLVLVYDQNNLIFCEGSRKAKFKISFTSIDHQLYSIVYYYIVTKFQ